MFRPFRNLLDDTTFIIVAIVIVGAFVIGGGHLLFQEKDYSTSGGGSGSNSPTANDWTIDYTLKGCVTAGADVEILAKGPDKGYVTLELKNGENFDIISTDEFKSSPSVWRPVLKSATGYNSKPWRLKLFQGGAINGGQWSGGTEKAVKQGNPTNCP